MLQQHYLAIILYHLIISNFSYSLLWLNDETTATAMSDEASSHHALNGRHDTLDPTGMFRNRGRHVVSAVSHDYNPERKDSQPLENNPADECSIEPLVQNMDELNGASNDTIPPDRSLTISGKALSLNSIQSSDAPAQINHNFSHDADARMMSSVQVSVISKSEDKRENTFQVENRTLALNAENLRHCSPQLDGSIPTQEAYETDSTISIMGSTTNNDLDDDEGVNKTDTLRWKSSIRLYRTNAGGDVIEENEGRDHNTNETMENVAHNESAQSINASSDDEIHSENLATNRDNKEYAMKCHTDTSHLLDESNFTMDDTEDSKQSNVVLVADFSDMSSIGNVVGNKGISDNTSVIHKAAQVSPVRLSFRNNIQRMTSPRLLGTNEIRSSTLPLPLQLARNCFSFQDTTIDEDRDVPYQTQIGAPDEVSTTQGSSKQQFYGLSAVASFPDEESNYLTKAIPLKRTSKSYQHQFVSGAKTQHNSPFRAIKRSKTWGDHNIGVDDNNVNNSHCNTNTHLMHRSDPLTQGHNLEVSIEIDLGVAASYIYRSLSCARYVNRKQRAY